MKKKYLVFFAMVLTATVIMYGLMYSTVYRWDHIFFSEMRTYMAVYMGGVMAIVMLAFMRHMYTNKKMNIAIYAVSALLIIGSFWLARNQATIDDVDYMQAMIPHHSIAILTSERAEISDPRVEQLAQDIIKAQREEIAKMKKLIDDLEEEEDE
ncbi:DUF305 domain-containing protein [Planococcus lenghuensis]|uniref:DUF305 domain-containing protein n=1 Tax=Planococcus lenghuensis TaxID=2213202 RepID=A0A1Q2KWY9_9BACL|nr:DUF305 domain-containing protein [Planococcus lenghuensis]AQQ52646.1 DUF305 domain-containing protein [Planococcus lenghuensis]